MDRGGPVLALPTMLLALNASVLFLAPPRTHSDSTRSDPDQLHGQGGL